MSDKSTSFGFYFEDFLEKAGTFGLFHVAFSFAMLFACTGFAGNVLFMSFATLQPNIYCDDSLSLNSTCNCDGAITTSTKYFHSIVQDFDLICANSYKSGLMSSIHIAGLDFGSPLGGHLADYFGRKPTFLAANVLISVFALASLVAPYWALFVGLRFLCSVGVSVAGVSMIVWGMESTSSKYNVVMSLMNMWPLGFLTFSLIAYFFPFWKYYTGISGIYPLLMIPIFMVFRESPRWLVQERRYGEAVKSLGQIEKWNKFKKKDNSFTKNDLEDIHLTPKLKCQKTFLTLFSDWTVTGHTLVLSLLTSCAAMNNVFFLYNLNALEANPFLNVIGYSILRILLVPLPLLFADQCIPCFGRRKLLALSLGIVAFMSGIIVIRYQIQNVNGNTVDILAALSASLSSLLWVTVHIYVTELYPSSVRSIAFSTVTFLGGIGAILAPQILYFETVWRPLPYAVMCVLCVFTMMLGLALLPETKNKPLNEDLY